jgi:4-aminobutyrate aminotransferase-like enzyme
MADITESPVYPQSPEGRRVRAETEQHLLKPMGDEPLVVTRAEGRRVWDADGKDYIDATSSEWVLHLGFGNQRVHNAIREQLDTVEYVSPVFESPPRTQLATKLAEITPGRLDKVLFATSGAEAVEGAMHLAMRKTGGSDFVCLDQAFHGRSFGTIGLSYSHPHMLDGSNRGLDRYLTRQIRLPNYDCYRCPLKLKRETCGLACAELVDYALERAHTHGPAGVIVEVVQANGGMIPAPDGFLQRVDEICEQRQVPLIVDEVQTGFCRCGTWSGSELYGIEPDIIVFGKSLGAGLPLTAAVATPEYGHLLAWEYGFTQAGNTLACTAANAMIEEMEVEKLGEHATRMGEILRGRLREIQQHSRLIGDVRGPGLMIGVDLVRDHDTREPANDAAAAVVNEAFRRGLLIGRSGPVFGAFGNVIKFKPAVNTTVDEIAEMADKFAASLAAVESQLS